MRTQDGIRTVIRGTILDWGENTNSARLTEGELNELDERLCKNIAAYFKNALR